MNVIGLLPVRNEGWILSHTLACLSGFCDVILVCDQHSEDDSRDVCRRFPKVTVIREAADLLPQRARWQLLDAARDYPGNNLLWNTDADEMISPVLVRRWLADERVRLTPGTFVDCGYYHVWDSPFTYRNDTSPYGPHLKDVAFVDDRHADYARSPDAAPLHEPRVPVHPGAPRIAAGERLPVLHLQWLLATRNQMKQAWYRAVELLDGRGSAAAINAFYSITLPVRSVATAPVPVEWLHELTFPDFSIDAQEAWHERELFRLFDRQGVEFFEPLEIWHVDRLQAEFRRRLGRTPRPDRSYLSSWRARARHSARRTARAIWRRVFA